MMLLLLTSITLQLSWSLPRLCSLSLVLSLFLAAGQGVTNIALVYAKVSNAVFLTMYFLVSLVFLCFSDLPLELLLGSARMCPGSICIALCGWKGIY